MKKPKQTAAVAPITKEPSPPAPVKEQQTLVLLTERLHDIRSEAMRNRTHTGKLITELQAKREQLDEMRTEIDATIAFLRAQHGK